ncbi:MAG: ABC-2 family transporter protein [Clostridia bacterium]|nr:ABC-2 family transporter protein [Clostridia bacterium]
MIKYFEIFKFNLKTKFNFKINYIFSLFSFTIHVLILNTLWDFILQGKTILGYTKPELIWYIIIGEFIAYSTSHNYKRISAMIKSGDVSNLLTKPIDIIKYLYAEELTVVFNIVINFIFAIILGLFITGGISISLIGVIISIWCSVMGIILWISIQVFIGLLAFLTEENEPFYLIISKGMLLLVLTPLEFFPNIMQKIFAFLPTTYTSYPAAKLFVHFNVTDTIRLCASQILSILLVCILIKVVMMKGVKNINVNGG